MPKRKNKALIIKIFIEVMLLKGKPFHQGIGRRAL
jgi:hypothetical protein